MFRKVSFSLTLALLFAFLAGCARAPIKDANQALRPTGFTATKLQDDLQLQGLAVALSRTISRTMEQLRQGGEQDLVFGPVRIQKTKYIAALNDLLQALDADVTGEKFRQVLQKNFEMYEVYGTDHWSKVFVTSYYTPRLQGSLKKTKKFSMPLYEEPRNMLFVDLTSFSERNPDIQVRGLWRARLETRDDGKKYVIPYDSREDIAAWPTRRAPAKVLCYVDPIDGFFLQIQGSGQVALPNGRSLNLNYAQQNGHPYFPIGRALRQWIPKEKMSMQAIDAYLRTLDVKKRREILNMNPSYVFFRRSDQRAVTSFGVPAVPGRTIATDDRYFPKGALAFLQYPSVDENDGGSHSRFVLNLDSGGAIKGPGRVDLYWGDHEDADAVSGRMKGDGALYFFVPKPRKEHNASQ